MERRSRIAVTMVIVGFALQGLAYFLLAAPLGRSTGVAYSNPRLPFAPLVFIAGVVTVFLAAVVYELLPDGPGAHREEER